MIVRTSRPTPNSVTSRNSILFGSRQNLSHVAMKSAGNTKEAGVGVFIGWVFSAVALQWLDFMIRGFVHSYFTI